MALLGRMLLGSLRDLAPVAVVILFFQIFVLGQPATSLLGLLEGAVLVIVGLTLFVYGLQLALFPIGEALAFALARRGSFPWLVLFAFLLGFCSTIAEPALTAVAAEAASAAAAAGLLDDLPTSHSRYALGLRLMVSCAVGTALVLGASRIIFGWPLPHIVAGLYLAGIALALLAPPGTIGIAYDVGGVTSSVITVPLVSALGIGLASSLSGRDPMTDGFGMIALVLLTPPLFVMGFGTLLAWL
jgi:hypothetical protein